jgi:hypothetical protein
MIPNLNYCPANEENYTAEQPSDNNFLAEIFSTHDQTKSYQTYDKTNFYQTNSYQTYDQANFYQTYDQTNSYPTYERTNFYPTYDRTNSYPYLAIYSNNIIYQQPNPAGPLYNFFGGSSSSTISGCNLADNIDRIEEKNNIDGRSSVDPTVMELSDGNDDQDDGGPYYSSEEETGDDYTERSDFSISESEDEEIQRCDTTLLVTGRTERRHPVEVLNNFEMFDRLGANEARLGLDDELAGNRIFASKSALN